MSDAIVFQHDFERMGKPNGSKFWMDQDLKQALGYQTESSWQKVINRATQVCMTLGLPVVENFAQAPGGGYKLNRFACYLIAMNGDPKKPEVAAAQAYFARLAESIHALYSHAEGVERVLYRSELTDGQKTLNSTAKDHGVENYAFFTNAGYRGMYNMNLKVLEARKGVPKGKALLDLMGKSELAANLFRITQTDEKIKNEQIRGQRRLEDAAHAVGRKVRQTMIDLSGTAPENLPIAEPIQEVRKALKGTSRRLKKLDDPRK